MKFVRNSRSVRAALLASAAGFGFAGTAMAQDVAGPVINRPSLDRAERVAQAASSPVLDIDQAQRVAQVASSPLLDISHVKVEAQTYLEQRPDNGPVPQVVIANPGTPTTAIDPNNVTGVGQMIIDEQNGFISLCTGTLINPRTVIFAAHCVNERAATAYGENSGGQPIGFGFNVNNNAAGASAFGGYLSNYRTNTSRNMYDANYVAYNPLSTEPNANGFLYGDVAVASLDTPAAGIPTWALLFSPLDDPGTIDANGTGYHVTIEGYGNNGTGTSGTPAGGNIDFRRRIAENMIGGLASIDEFENFIFNTHSTTNPANLYWMDFDDPRRGSTTNPPSIFDFNAWRDNALPNEGITSGGDSGGPLVLDQEYARKLVIGVLSGGYTTFFGNPPQPNNGYGTASFYQPLYLYWDWVAANNPYHYVAAKAGDGNWTDPTHWVTGLDPAYYVIDGSTVVNGTPGTPGAGATDQPGFGQACIQGPSAGFGGASGSDCYDISSGHETYDPTGHPIGTGGTASADDKGTALAGSLNGTATDDKASVSASSLDSDSSGSDEGSQGPQVAVAAPALPSPTLDNGLPGATNFVPNNYDGNRNATDPSQIKPRYFDVTLGATGTTTVNSAITVDNLTLNGAGAALNIASNGTLTSNLGISQKIGTMQVNGTLNSGGDYFLLMGGLNGTGKINAPFFTNTAGTIAPGTAGTVGTLTFRGNVILASGSTYLVDLGANGTSDRIAVESTTFNGNTPTNGIANLGGRLVFNFTDTLRAGQIFTILTAQGGVTSKFQTPDAITAILTPKVSYGSNSVLVQIEAGSYASVIDRNSSVQVGFANILDQNRSRASQLDGIYGPLDLQNQSTIRSTLEGLAPTTETTVRALGKGMVESMAGLFHDRLQSLDVGSAGGTVAHIGQPLRVASNNLVDHSNLAAANVVGGNETTVQEGALPEDMSGFIAGGYLDGNSAPMPAAIANGRDKFNGYYVAGGLEKLVGSDSAIGFAGSYSKSDTDGAIAGHNAGANLIAGTLYGKYQAASGLTLDSQISAGILDTTTTRTVNFVGNTYTLEANDKALAFSSEAGLGYKINTGNAFVTPRVAWRTTYIDFSRTRETGGPVAMTYHRNPVSSSQARGSLTLGGAGAFKPFVTGTLVHDFGKEPSAFMANFVGGGIGGGLFETSSRDRNWAEVAGGLTYRTHSVDLSIAGEATFGRTDVETRNIRGSIGFHF